MPSDIEVLTLDDNSPIIVTKKVTKNPLKKKWRTVRKSTGVGGKAPHSILPFKPLRKNLPIRRTPPTTKKVHRVKNKEPEYFDVSDDSEDDDIQVLDPASTGDPLDEIEVVYEQQTDSFCDMCGLYLEDQKEMEYHHEDSHELVTCKWCSKKLDVTQVKSHIGEGQCSKFSKLLGSHCSVHDEIETIEMEKTRTSCRPHVCQVCSQKYDLETLREKDSRTGEFICPGCLHGRIRVPGDELTKEASSTKVVNPIEDITDINEVINPITEEADQSNIVVSSLLPEVLLLDDNEDESDVIRNAPKENKTKEQYIMSTTVTLDEGETSAEVRPAEIKDCEAPNLKTKEIGDEVINDKLVKIMSTEVKNPWRELNKASEGDNNLKKDNNDGSNKDTVENIDELLGDDDSNGVDVENTGGKIIEEIQIITDLDNDSNNSESSKDDQPNDQNESMDQSDSNSEKLIASKPVDEDLIEVSKSFSVPATPVRRVARKSTRPPSNPQKPSSPISGPIDVQDIEMFETPSPKRRLPSPDASTGNSRKVARKSTRPPVNPQRRIHMDLENKFNNLSSSESNTRARGDNTDSNIPTVVEQISKVSEDNLTGKTLPEFDIVDSSRKEKENSSNELSCDQLDNNEIAAEIVCEQSSNTTIEDKSKMYAEMLLEEDIEVIKEIPVENIKSSQNLHDDDIEIVNEAPSEKLKSSNNQDDIEIVEDKSSLDEDIEILEVNEKVGLNYFDKVAELDIVTSGDHDTSLLLDTPEKSEAFPAIFTLEEIERQTSSLVF